MRNALLLYPAWLLCLGVALALVLRVRVRAWVATMAACIGVAAFVAYPLLNTLKGTDIEWFWKGGTSLRAGASPYVNSGCQNPPTAFPLYLAVSALPLAQASTVWTILLVLAALLLVETARRALMACGDDTAANLGWPLVAVLTAVVCLSRSTRYCLDLGQLGVLLALVLFGVVWAWGRQRWFAAGSGLALASIKTPSMLPFLLLFAHRKYWRVGLAMSVVGLGLVLSVVPANEVLQRCRECLSNIAANRQPGQIDDPSLKGWNTSGIVGLAMIVHRLGIPVEIAGIVEAVALLALGAWVLWGVKRLERPAAACLVALFATVFLYHRHYDLVLLTLPFVYVVGKVREEVGLRRGLYAGVAACILVGLNVDIWFLSHLGRDVVQGADATTWLLRAFVVPCVTWLVLLSMTLLVCAERCEASGGRQSPGMDAPRGTVVPRSPLRLVGVRERDEASWVTPSPIS